MAVERARVGELHQPAAAEHRHLVGHRQRLGLVVGDQHRGRAGGPQRVGDREAGLLAQGGVQGGERLVEQHQRGLGRQGAGERHALLLAAGELVRRAVGQLGAQAHQGEQLADPAAVPALATRQAEADVGGDR